MSRPRRSYDSEAIKHLLERIAQGFPPTVEEMQQLAEAERLNADRATDRPTEPQKYSRALHRIGRVRLDHYIHRRREVFEVYLNDRLVSQSLNVHDALHGARKYLPRPAKRVQGEIIAYRGWRLHGDLLGPLTQDAYENLWLGPVATAALNSDYNGLYSVKLQHAEELVQSYVPTVHGLVGLFGRVIEHERGYRSQKQIVRALRVALPVGDLLLKALEERYQCPVFRTTAPRHFH